MLLHAVAQHTDIVLVLINDLTAAGQEEAEAD